MSTFSPPSRLGPQVLNLKPRQESCALLRQAVSCTLNFIPTLSLSTMATSYPPFDPDPDLKVEASMMLTLMLL
jgi:hypothetical protein